MSGDRGPDGMRSDLSMAGQQDALCDEFEAVLRKAAEIGTAQPRIEDFLDRIVEVRRAELLRELLEIELDLRGQRGETVLIEEYRGRFPELVEVVDAIFPTVVEARRLGEYQLMEELGHGGMGVVYRARHMMLGQIVALKVLPEKYLDNEQIVSRFLREIRSIGRLKHPNIVHAQNAGEAGGVHFLVMEYVDGVTLDRLVGHNRALPVPAACELIRQAALGSFIGT